MYVAVDGLNEVLIGNKENKSYNKSHLSSFICNNGDTDTFSSYLSSSRPK